jgi:pyrroline-5-carboxylate reductase
VTEAQHRDLFSRQAGMTLGFIGTGAIAAALVEGLQSAPDAPAILLSPRNAATAARLASQFSNVQVATGNQAVLDGSDTIVLAVRPQIAHDVLSQLRFLPNHRVISLIPAVTLEYLRNVTAPAAAVTRAVPLPSAARRQSPTPIYPVDPAVKALFNHLGVAIELDREEEFEAFTTASAIMSSYFRTADTISGWMEREGVAPEKAHMYVSQILRGLAGASAASPQSSFADLTADHQTAGGLNEQVNRSLTEAGVFNQWDRALDDILARLIAGRFK